MSEPLPVVLVPGLLCSARLYAAQIPQLWSCGPVTIADHTRDDTMAAIARRILAAAPPRFALAGLSMGGYLSFEILRQAADRVVKLALLDTSARADTPEAVAARKAQIAQAAAGGLAEVADAQFMRLVHPARREDSSLREVNRMMSREVGAQAFIRQQTAIVGRVDSRPMLKDIRCPTLVLVGEADALTPPDRAAEMAAGIPGARLVQVPECGHLSTLERPEAVTAALLEWLQS
ncbi:MAG TPA: alpha/beta fold hydrolase [Steroidobacteraceae bacterium]|jgi:pimeloyl-ACP methyl ester carboxylesterase